MTPIADPETQAAAALKMALRAVLLSGEARAAGLAHPNLKEPHP